jgi:hypothetical protein
LKSQISARACAIHTVKEWLDVNDMVLAAEVLSKRSRSTQKGTRSLFWARKKRPGPFLRGAMSDALRDNDVVRELSPDCFFFGSARFDESVQTFAEDVDAAGRSESELAKPSGHRLFTRQVACFDCGAGQ